MSGPLLHAWQPLQMMEPVMNIFERKPGVAQEAQVQYLDGDFRIVKPGAFVKCGVTGQPIAIEDLRYWDVQLQEAYASTDAILIRRGEKKQS